MIVVPEAATLPMTARPVRRENSWITSAGKPSRKYRERAVEDHLVFECGHALMIAKQKYLASTQVFDAVRREGVCSRSSSFRPANGWLGSTMPATDQSVQLLSATAQTVRRASAAV